MWHKWKSIALWKKNLAALVLGVVFGLIFKNHIDFLQPIGNAFINLLKMMVMPLVFVTLIHSIINLTSTEKIVSLAVKTVLLFIATTAVAIIMSIVAAEFIKPGTGINITFPVHGGQSVTEAPSLLVTLLNIIPPNPFKSFVEGNVLQVVFLALFTGIVLAKLKTDKTQLANIVNIVNEVIFSMIAFIVELMPIGIFALLAYSASVMGYDLIVKLAVFVTLVCALCLIQMFIVYSIILKLTGNSVIKFFKGAAQAMLTAFSLSSSSATLPVTMECAKKMKISEAARAFIIPLGSTINMNGAAIQQTVITIFVAQMVGFELHFYHYAVILLTTLVSTIGTAGVPSAGLIMTSVVLNALGLPIEGIAIVAGVDRIIDMITTSTNVTGDLVVAKILSNKEKKVVARANSKLVAEKSS